MCIPTPTELSLEPDVYTRELEGGLVAKTIHQGRYEEISPAYHTLSGWISENGYDIAGPPREIYLNDPQTELPEDLLTRVEFPIIPATN